MIFRVLFFCLVFLPATLLLIPVQWLIVKLNLPFWNGLPRLFHRAGCVFLGLNVTVIGEPATGRATLLTSNHISWTDIVAIGSVADITFVATSKLLQWPLIGFLATLQKTIFTDRTKHGDAKRTSTEMADRMAHGGAVLLFAEGQSDIGTHVLPFRSALVGSAQAAMIEAGANKVAIQPVTIAYTKLQGLPVSRHERSLIAWIRSKSAAENIRDILQSGVKDVTVAFGYPLPLTEADDRKDITKRMEDQVRRMLVALNRFEPVPSDYTDGPPKLLAPPPAEGADGA